MNEIYHLGDEFSSSPWPRYEEEKTVSQTLKIGVQVNGKLRATIEVVKDTSKDELEKLAISEENVQKHIEGKEIIKIIAIPNRIVNIVVK